MHFLVSKDNLNSFKIIRIKLKNDQDEYLHPLFKVKEIGYLNKGRGCDKK